MTAEKLAIVTGANKGLGLALVKGLCEKFEGHVYLTSRDEVRGLEACQKLRDLGLKMGYHQLDITDSESILRFSEYVRGKYGKIDLLINNAGVLFLKDSKEPWVYQAEQTMRVNFFSLVNFTEAMLPLMKNGGKIVNISSSSGHLSRIPSGVREVISKIDSVSELEDVMRSYLIAVNSGQDNETWGDSPYVVSKVGVNAYTFILHRKLFSKNISVNSVHPGYVRSDMTRGAGTVSPVEAAVVVLTLALENPSSGLYLWHDGTSVEWGGDDPRMFIDGKV